MKENSRDGAPGKARVVIVGGGFGGMYCALGLERALGRGANLEVTLVNRDNFFLFTPMLHEVAASDLDVTHIVNPAHKMLRRVTFSCGEVESIDCHKRSVTVAYGAGHRAELGYDHLVLALGSVTDFSHAPALEGKALGMKTLDDAIRLRNQLLACLEEAALESDAARRRALLTVVVAGGGFAGVETTGAVNDFLREAIRFYPRLNRREAKVILLQHGDRLLPEFGGSLSDYTRRMLERRGVQVRLRTAATDWRDNSVVLGDGATIAARTLVWTAGVSPHPLIESLPCRKDRGRVVADACMRVQDVEGGASVWALGDCALVPAPNGKPYAPLAQHAQRQGKHLAHNLEAAAGAEEPSPFVYTTKGQMAAIGQRSGVAQIGGYRFSGFPAWWLWRTYYLMTLPRFEKKLRVVLDWTLDLFFSKDLVQFMADPAAPPSAPDGGSNQDGASRPQVLPETST